MKSKVLIILLGVVILLSIDNVSALSNCNLGQSKSIGNIKNNLTIEVYGEEQPLYCVFEDDKMAIENLKKEIPELLRKLKERASLDEINVDNVESYREELFNYLNSSNSSLKEKSITKELNPIYESDQDVILLRSFFDIYENKEVNNDIISLVLESNKKDSNKSMIESELFLSLPYYAPLVEKKNKEIISKGTKAAFNKLNGSIYAIDYAVNPNTPLYANLSLDSANFTSQILEAGGVSQEFYSSENLGWWHKRTKILFVWHHTHSKSWNEADVFARYMGIGYMSISNYHFTINIMGGDFIAADFTNDGSWDHMAYVVGKNDYLGTYSGQIYFNYKVAQHSTNYFEWTSSSINGWNNIEGSGVYARVRR